MSNPCDVEKVLLGYNTDVTTIQPNITGECATRLQYNTGIIRGILQIPKITGGITRFDRAYLSESLKNDISQWRNRESDRREFAGYLDRNLNIISPVILSQNDSGISKEEIKSLGDIDGILFHTHPIYRDKKVVAPPSNDDINTIYLEAMRSGKNKINIVFAKEGVYVYCLYPEAFLRIMNQYNLQENKESFENIINNDVSENLAVMMHNLGINTENNEFIRPTLDVQEYLTLLRTCGIYIQLHSYDEEILIPIFDEVNIDLSIPINIEPYPFTRTTTRTRSRIEPVDFRPIRLDSNQEYRPLNFDSDQEEEMPRPLNFDSDQEEETLPIPPPPKKTGRRLFDGGDDYKAKYLKYKTKYLELKKQIQK